MPVREIGQGRKQIFGASNALAQKKSRHLPALWSLKLSIIVFTVRLRRGI